MSTNNSPRRIAPLNSDQPNTHNAPSLKGIIFDVDGTLCLPQNYMFKEMRSALSIPKSQDILDHLSSLSGDDLKRAQKSIKDIEMRAMKDQTPQPGLVEMVKHFVEVRGDVKLALCTRNFELPVSHLLEKNLTEQQRGKFWPIVTRETEGVKPKPSPEGIWACVGAWEGKVDVAGSKEGEVENERISGQGLDGVSEKEKKEMCRGVLMVGDSVDDIEAGNRAGAISVLLINEENKALMDGEDVKRPDVGIHRLDELIGLLDNGLEARS